jgi:NhaP-type Na+/H+ or K+/H+ antiporter
VLATVAACVVLWGLVGARLERLNVTAPIAFVALGLLVANPPLALIEVHPGSSTVRIVAELTLALVLFGDASRVNFRALRRDAAVPTRLLLIGLPLTIALGTALALVVFGGMDPWLAALIGAAVAPTDAALGAPIMEDQRIPRRVRRVLNVESGLNDGIATPFVACFIAGAASEANVVGASGPAAALADLGVGVLVGVVVGFTGGWLLDRAQNRGWSSPAFRPVAVLGLAVLAYAGALQLGGNGFIAAFVGGLAFGSAVRDERGEGLDLVTDGGELLSVVVWFLFGTFLVQVFGYADWRAVLYAVLSLTVVRMLPVAVSLLGTGLDQSTVKIIGWFGPRGLASVVFALLAFDALDTNEGRTALAVITTVVLASVIAHGFSASPLAGWYARHAASLEPERPEHQEAPHLPTRPFTRRRKRDS